MHFLRALKRFTDVYLTLMASNKQVKCRVSHNIVCGESQEKHTHGETKRRCAFARRPDDVVAQGPLHYVAHKMIYICTRVSARARACSGVRRRVMAVVVVVAVHCANIANISTHILINTGPDRCGRALGVR